MILSLGASLLHDSCFQIFLAKGRLIQLRSVVISVRMFLYNSRYTLLKFFDASVIKIT